jgi:hypothetical protein
LQSTLKRLGVNTIPGIEEVNIFKDEFVIHFVNPKGKATSPNSQEILCSNAKSLLHFLHTSEIAWCWQHVLIANACSLV